MHYQSKQSLYDLFTFGAFFIPMTIMMVVYTRIYVEARKRIHGKANLNGIQSVKHPTAGELSMKFVGLLKKISTSESTITESENQTSILEPPVRCNGQRHRSSPALIASKVPVPNSPDPYLRNSLSAQPSQHTPEQSRCPSIRPHLTIAVCTFPYPVQPTYSSESSNGRTCLIARTESDEDPSNCHWDLPHLLAAVFHHCSGPAVLPALRSSLFLEAHLPVAGYFNSMINPILYTKFNNDFQNAFRKLLLCKPKNSSNGQLGRPPCRINGDDQSQTKVLNRGDQSSTKLLNKVDQSSTKLLNGVDQSSTKLLNESTNHQPRY